MRPTLPRPPSRASFSETPVRPRCLRSRRSVSWLAAVCAALLLGGTALRAHADTAHIYLYNGSGTPTDVSASYLYQEHHVFDLAGNLVGNVDSAYAVYNLSGQQIGYVTFVPAG